LVLIDKKGKWNEGTLLECKKKCFEERALKQYRSIPLIVSSAIRLARNASIFEGKESPPFQVHHQIKFLFEGLNQVPKMKKPRKVRLLEADKS